MQEHSRKCALHAGRLICVSALWHGGWCVNVRERYLFENSVYVSRFTNWEDRMFLVDKRGVPWHVCVLWCRFKDASARGLYQVDAVAHLPVHRAWKVPDCRVSRQLGWLSLGQAETFYAVIGILRSSTRNSFLHGTFGSLAASTILGRLVSSASFRDLSNFRRTYTMSRDHWIPISPLGTSFSRSRRSECLK